MNIFCMSFEKKITLNIVPCFLNFNQFYALKKLNPNYNFPKIHCYLSHQVFSSILIKTFNLYPHTYYLFNSDSIICIFFSAGVFRFQQFFVLSFFQDKSIFRLLYECYLCQIKLEKPKIQRKSSNQYNFFLSESRREKLINDEYFSNNRVFKMKFLSIQRKSTWFSIQYNFIKIDHIIFWKISRFFIQVIIIDEPSYQFLKNNGFLQSNKYQTQMTERRAWTPEQDRALKELRQVLKVKKWSDISRKLKFEYQIFERNGKQCRERYTNHLNENINSQELSLDEEQKLYKLHDLIGNKWSHISKQFNGRTENHIKNHFHSKMRKAIRKLNKQLKLYFKKTIKPYKLSIVYRIIEASDFRFSKSTLFDEKDLKFFNDLKNILLAYAGGFMQEKTSMPEVQGKEKVLLLLEIIANFENQMKINKLNLTCTKSNAKKREVNITCSSKKNNTTTGSQFSEENKTQKQVQDYLYENSISSEISLQFVDPTNQINQGFKGMEEQLTKLGIPKEQNRRFKDTELENIQRSSSINNKNQLLQEVPFTKKQQNILISLIEEQEFPSSNLQRKMSIKSFESLKQFQDNYLNDSEIHSMLKKFNSFQNIDSTIFE